jgi:hypothetical protein
MKCIGCAAALLFALTLAAPPASASTPHRTRHPKRHKIIHAAGWKGAGLAAGHFAGPAGSAAVGATKYRKDLKRGGHARRRAMVKIGAPIAAGAVAGPAGAAGYEAYDHRSWIKRHLFRKKRPASRKKSPQRR